MKSFIWSIKYFKSRNESLFRIIFFVFALLFVVGIVFFIKCSQSNKQDAVGESQSVNVSSDSIEKSSEPMLDNKVESSVTESNNSTIPVDAKEFSGHMYCIYIDGCGWESAKEKCESINGHLVTITSSEEQSFIDELNADNNRLWIGGYRNSSATWNWLTGETWIYSNWGDGEPNDSSNVISNENRCSIWPSEWNDLNENSQEQEGYICEWDYNE